MECCDAQAHEVVILLQKFGIGWIIKRFLCFVFILQASKICTILSVIIAYWLWIISICTVAATTSCISIVSIISIIQLSIIAHSILKRQVSVCIFIV